MFLRKALFFWMEQIFLIFTSQILHRLEAERLVLFFKSLILFRLLQLLKMLRCLSFFRVFLKMSDWREQKSCCLVSVLVTDCIISLQSFLAVNNRGLRLRG